MESCIYCNSLVTLFFSPSGMREHPLISTTDLANHIERLKANDGLRFSQEYEVTTPALLFTADHHWLSTTQFLNL